MQTKQNKTMTSISDGTSDKNDGSLKQEGENGWFSS